LDTYYVYDYFGNLIYVIPPKAIESLVINTPGTSNYSQVITLGNIMNGVRGLLSGSTAGVLQKDFEDETFLQLNFDFTVTSGATLKTGAIIALTEHYPDMILGNITNGIYNFQISIENDYLVVTDINGEPIPANTGIFRLFLVPIPPFEMFPIDLAVWNELCYQYRYDDKNRLVEKKVPGKDWEYVVYDKLNRPVLTQNAINRYTNEWLFVKYDKFNRTVYTGEHTNTASRAFIQQYIDNQSNPVLFEQQNSSFINSGAVVNYTNDAFPDTDIEVNSIMYYDNYNFSLAGITVPTVSTPAYSTAITTVTKGLVTGSKIKTLETNNWTTTAIVYDEKARPVWVKSVNDYLGTTDEVETKLDFIGQALENKTIHNKIPVVTNLTTFDYFTYDHAGRLLKHTQKIGAADEELISFNQYDDLGQLVQQKIGGTPASTYTAAQGLQTIDYSFNVRGWLKGINDTGSLGNDLFAYAIKYNAPTAGTALYNGNISQTFWKTANDNELRGYTYTYDKLDRLTEAQFTNANNTAQNNSYSLKNVTYDANGNITFLHRSGDVISNANQESMDYMYYHYEGNKLVRVEEQGHGSIGFATLVSASDTSVQYSYDNNGNVQSDNNKEISDINYNYFNQPLHIAFNDPSKYIDFVYNAGGVKLSKTVTVGSNTTTTYYAGNYIYEETSNTTVLQCIAQPQGYVTVNGGDYNYVYQYKDHVGNIRLSYTQDSNGQLQIVEENNYFPFGMKHTGYNNVVSSLGNSVANGFDFLGKENLEIGGVDLKLTEMDFRKYDVALGRFNGIDLLAEDGQFSVTPYHYAANNPVLFSDPSGLKIKFSETSNVNDLPEYIQSMWDATPDGGSSMWYNNGGGGLGGGSFSGDIFGADGFTIAVGDIGYDGYADISQITSLLGIEVIGSTTGQNHWGDGVVSAYAGVIAGQMGYNPVSAVSSSFGVKDVLRTGADFIPIVGSGLDIYEGIRDGNGLQALAGVGFLIVDVATLGSGSLVKGAVKTAVKQGVKSTFPNAVKKFTKHAGEFTSISDVNAYVKRATNLLNSNTGGNILGFTSKEGWVFRMNSRTGEFLTRNPAGEITTFFRRMDDPIAYWAAQIENYGR
jgi:RHS repeat-associated protein